MEKGRNALLHFSVPAWSVRLYRFSTLIRPQRMLSLKKSFTEHPARPEAAQAQAKEGVFVYENPREKVNLEI